jgi:hypothetical protein
MNSITQPDQPNWPGPTQSMPFEHPSFFARYLCFWGIAFNEAIPSRYFLSFTHARNSDTSCYFSSTANITDRNQFISVIRSAFPAPGTRAACPSPARRTP